MQSAKEIYQERMDIATNAFFNWDFEGVRKTLFFPTLIETDDKVVRLETWEDYFPWILGYRKKMDAYGVTSYHRICRQAMSGYMDSDRIEGIHETYILHKTTPVVEPYLVQATLIRSNGAWLSAASRASVDNPSWSIIANKEPVDEWLAEQAPEKELHS